MQAAATARVLAIRNLPAFLLLLFALPLLSACGYNTIPTLEENAKAEWSEVLNQYQRRADLIPNLVETVKGYAAHEKEVLESVVEARAKATQVTVSPETLSDPEAFKAFQESQSGLTASLSKLLAVVENYPDLKANQNFLALQAQLEGTENRIAVARRDYIEAVREYNTAEDLPVRAVGDVLVHQQRAVPDLHRARGQDGDCRRSISGREIELRMAGRSRRLIMTSTPPSGLPAISPSRGEIGSVNDAARPATLAIGESIAAIQSPPLRGRWPAGQRVHQTALSLFVGILFAILLPFLALAAELPTLTGRIVDNADLMDAAAEAALTQKLADFEKKGSDQIVVATVPSLDGEPIESYSNRLFRAWGLGQAGENNGILLVVAKNDRKMRIEVGYGLEGTLTDLHSKLIIENTMVPAFRAGDFAGGISRAVDDIIMVLEGNAAELEARGERNPPSTYSRWTSDDYFTFFFIDLGNAVLRRFRHGDPAADLRSQDRPRPLPLARHGFRATAVPGRSSSDSWSSGSSSGGWSSGQVGRLELVLRFQQRRRRLLRRRRFVRRRRLVGELVAHGARNDQGGA